MKVIIYGSCYGTTKQYAEELSKRTKIDLKPYQEIKNINRYETIIYLGALYAGGVLGLSQTLKKLDSCANKKIIIITVGLADPVDKENISNINNSLKRQLSKEIYKQASIYHLRGGIDYSKLNFKHKTMMKLLYKKAVTLPEIKKTAEVKAMIETYNKKVSFVDFSSLDKIIAELS